MRFLRTNTAIRLTVGPFLDKTDGITPETGLTVTNCHLTLMVDDSNVPTLVLDASATASGGNNDMVHVTGDDAGFYDLELTAANLNYLGRAMLAITDAANHCPVFHEFMILPTAVYDSLVLGTNSTVDAAGLRTALGMASANLDTQLTAIDDYIDTEVAAIKAKTDNLPASPAAASDCITAAGVRTAVGLGSANLDTQLSAIAGYIDTEVSAIKAKTDNLPSDPADASDVAAAVALVPGLVWDVVLASHLTAGTTGAALNSSSSAGDPWSTSLPGAYAVGTAGYIVGNQLPVVLDRGTCPSQSGMTSTEIKLATSASNVSNVYAGDSVVIISGTGVGQSRSITAWVGSTTRKATVYPAWTTQPDNTSVYMILPGNYNTATVEGLAYWASFSSSIPALVWDEDITLHSLTNSTGDALASASSGGDPSVIAAAVWDEVLAGHLTSGTTGAALGAAQSAGDPWSTSLPGSYPAGTAGYIIGTNIDTRLSTIQTSITNISTGGGQSVIILNNNQANSYTLGSPVLIINIFNDTSGNIDPDTVTLKIWSPSHSILEFPDDPATTLVYGTDAEVIRDSTGHYHVDYTPASVGTWTYQWVSTGFGASASVPTSFRVGRSAPGIAGTVNDSPPDLV